MARSRSGTRGRRGPKKPRKWPDSTESAVKIADPATRGAVEIPDSITVKELAELIGINSADVIRPSALGSEPDRRRISRAKSYQEHESLLVTWYSPVNPRDSRRATASARSLA